jgi:hypothetical protein
MTDTKSNAQQALGQGIIAELREARLDALARLRVPFPPHQISRLPKPTPKQTDALKQNMSLGIRCKECGQWHHKDAIHLDYVGHAALTDRLLDCDPSWNWEPLAMGPNGAPVLDGDGGMWIRLTVCGVTRLGYGHADGKRGGNATKEVIGDALRNAAMRFGAALDLWHKGDLHGDDEGRDDEGSPVKTTPATAMSGGLLQAWEDSILDSLPENPSPRVKAEAFAKAICEGFAGKGEKALDTEWDRRKKYIDAFQKNYPDLYGQVVEAYERRKAEMFSA